MNKFPSIDQFRHVVEAVEHKATYIGRSADDAPLYDKTLARPVLTFKGHVKLHGTNAGMGFDLLTNDVYTQSRERRLSLEDDNQGFHAFVTGLAVWPWVRFLKEACLRTVPEALDNLVNITVYGEFCGPQVNAKTAIGQVPNSWVLVAVAAYTADGQRIWLPLEALAHHYKECSACVRGLVNHIYFITDFPSFELTIDFNAPADVLDALEELTLQVEESCPVARTLGKEGIGEGIVWTCDHPQYGRLWFKTKGAKHKGTKNRRLVDIAPEVLASQSAFVDAVLTESRLEQGFDLICARAGKVTADHMGEFLMWVGQDVMKEESDTLKASGLDRKQAMGAINRKAKAWVTPRLSQF